MIPTSSSVRVVLIQPGIAWLGRGATPGSAMSALDNGGQTHRLVSHFPSYPLGHQMLPIDRMKKPGIAGAWSRGVRLDLLQL